MSHSALVLLTFVVLATSEGSRPTSRPVLLEEAIEDADVHASTQLVSIRPFVNNIMFVAKTPLLPTQGHSCPGSYAVTVISYSVSRGCGRENERCDRLKMVNLPRSRKGLLLPVSDRLLMMVIDGSRGDIPVSDVSGQLDCYPSTIVDAANTTYLMCMADDANRVYIMGLNIDAETPEDSDVKRLGFVNVDASDGAVADSSQFVVVGTGTNQLVTFVVGRRIYWFGPLRMAIGSLEGILQESCSRHTADVHRLGFHTLLVICGPTYSRYDILKEEIVNAGPANMNNEQYACPGHSMAVTRRGSNMTLQEPCDEFDAPVPRKVVLEGESSTNGHCFGSAEYQLFVHRNGTSRQVVFSLSEGETWTDTDGYDSTLSAVRLLTDHHTLEVVDRDEIVVTDYKSAPKVQRLFSCDGLDLFVPSRASMDYLVLRDDK